MNKKRFSFLLLFVVLSLILLNYGCGGKTEFVRCSIRTKWIFNGTVSEIFFGKAKGYYREEGIELAIRPGGPGVSGSTLVASGTDTFAITGAEELIRARKMGIDVVAIAVIFKKNPVCFLARKASDIKEPQNFSGKSIAVVYGENTETQYRALLKKVNLSEKDVKEVPWNFDLTQFILGKIDVIPAYSFDQPLFLKGQIDFNIIEPIKYGINPYGDILITSSKTISAENDLVKRFVRAFVRSLKDAVATPEEAVRMLVKEIPSLNFMKELDNWKLASQYISDNIEDIGSMDYDRWKYIVDYLKEFGGLDVDNSFPIHKCFNNNFIELMKIK